MSFALPRAWLSAVILTALQVGVLMLFVPGVVDLGGRYQKLNNWDSFHYADMLEHGYHMPPSGRPLAPSDVHEFRANLSYFPGYWVAGTTVRRLLSVAWPAVSTGTVLLVTAQLFAVVFWGYLGLLFALGRVTPDRTLFYLALIVAYPSAFFLVCGYSESTFMALLVGFIYWVERWIAESESKSRGKIFWVIATLHGFAMVGTRIVGIPVAAYPVVRWWLSTRPRPFQLSSLWRPSPLRDRQFILGALMTAISLSAAVGFLAYCQLQFGRWDWYFRLQTIGWGKNPNYLALFDPRSYIPRFFFEPTVSSISRTAVPFTLWLLWRDFRADTPGGRRKRGGLYFAAFSLFYIALAAKADTDMDSMIRYTWPAVALLALAWASIQAERPTPRPRRFAKVSWSVAVILAVAIQVWFMCRYLRGRWVA